MIVYLTVENIISLKKIAIFIFALNFTAPINIIVSLLALLNALHPISYACKVVPAFEN